MEEELLVIVVAGVDSMAVVAASEVAEERLMSVDAVLEGERYIGPPNSPMVVVSLSVSSLLLLSSP